MAVDLAPDAPIASYATVGRPWGSVKLGFLAPRLAPETQLLCIAPQHGH